MATKDMVIRHDEPNLARLNLVLALNRTELSEWAREISVDAMGTISIRCTAPRHGLVPHGIDNDILLGLVNAAVLQGLPEDDTVRLSTRELLQLSGITPSARAYKNLQETLRRLQYTAYDLTDSWYDGTKHRWRTVSFSLISRLGAEDNTKDVSNAGQWRAETLLAIRLDDSLMSNIRAGHLLPLDTEVLSHLRQPMTRNVFRTLSFQCTGASQDSVLAFHVPLSIWATHLGMHELRSDSVMRALKPAHDELIKVGFLKSVDYTGRGKTRTIRYIFDNIRTVADPETVALLVRYNVSGSRALTLAQSYGAEGVQRAVAVLEALLQGSYKTKIRNRAGLLSDILENPDKYDTILTDVEGTAVSVEVDCKARRVETEESPAPRDEKSARMILLNQLDDTEERRRLRDRAVELYVHHRASTLELMKLLRLSDEEADAFLTELERR
ncbi:replication initiator protein A [Deinococcus sp. SL84]|uniref:replication initiator protein A n=1 Tax=Deinococcus sp. SL84 TaxID=2994663 RepID=UPI002277013D|nr:replication initiator protein A [Deinococcus sp. SL84]MCY1704342.1 replication initiator protein A [Deinococcus sp. SL84]